MAKLKYVFLAHYNEANGTPLRSRLFAKIHSASRIASFFPSIANWTLTNSLVRTALDRFVGIDARRKLPAFANQTFESWFKKRDASPAREKKVLLFHDTFINFNYPDIGKAATEVLEAAGHE